MVKCADSMVEHTEKHAVCVTYFAYTVHQAVCILCSFSVHQAVCFAVLSMRHQAVCIVCIRQCAYFASGSVHTLHQAVCILCIRQCALSGSVHEFASGSVCTGLHQAVCTIRQCVHRFADRALTPGNLQLGITALFIPLLYLTPSSQPTVFNIIQLSDVWLGSSGLWAMVNKTSKSKSLIVPLTQHKKPCLGCRREESQHTSTGIVHCERNGHLHTGEREQGPEFAG